MPNRTEDHRLAIESALAHLLWHDGVRQQVGLAGLSQIWEEEPSWYFWLRGTPGALLLRRIACEPVKSGTHATFLVHHFPDGSADPEMKKLVRSGVFDGQTGTPVFERRQEVYHRFVDGEIGLSLSEERQPRLACCSWRQGGGAATRALFDVLMKTFVFYHRQAPEIVRRGWPEPGVKTFFAVYDGDFFRRFLEDLSAGIILQPPSPPPAEWQEMATASGACTVRGVCGCSH